MDNDLQLNNIYKSLLKTKLDPSVGIKSAHLIGDDSLSLYVAEIGSYKKVGAHYHLTGSEIYQIIDGEGEIHIGKIFNKNKVNWVISKKVKKGDCFIVKEMEAHQLINKQEKKLIIQFYCPKSHLLENRIMVSDYKG